ncbi:MULTISPECIES: GntR family transcriptional regulator [Mameliella]|uniref:GntR family transcriptional regulator n=1 Tax=Mameliella TaxID=1434019 RepID=UPI000B52C0C1|nr:MULTISPECIES: GntR family transcriptional regulator [Mameliella]MCR9273618.1 GntR family transcriptional regulator [Paracoccaceae bacterium]OWV55082.1 GntR family transcriptional regulator [Mameliella alba]
MNAEGSGTWELDPALPISRQILRILRERIIHNDLKPGDRLSESEVARTYDVSRQPVREAFIRLADLGLLAVLPQRGTIVSRIGYSAVLDARFLREAIEADIAKILARAPDPAVIAELRGQLIRQEEAEGGDPNDFIDLDDLFHRTLAEAAGKGGAWKQIEGLKAQMDRVRFLSLGHFPLRKLIAQHRDIVDQIERGAITGANSAVRHHLREVLSDLPQIVAANAAYFELPDGALPQPVNAPIQGGEQG